MKCVYCKNLSVGQDALGLPACRDHTHEADTYYEDCFGRDPNEDPFEFCDEHSDFWLAGCERCEACSQHHYGCGIAEANAKGIFDVQVWTSPDIAPQIFHMSHGEDDE